MLRIASVLALAFSISAFADPAEKAQASIDKSVAWLKTQQKADGSWQKKDEPPAVGALVLRTLLGDPKSHGETPEIKKGFEKLLSYQLDNGGIFKDLQGTYNTAIAVSALAAAKNPAYDGAIQKALAYLKSLQWSDSIANQPNGTKVDDKNPNFGGWGYGGRGRAAGNGRADGSNLQLALDALTDAGLTCDDPAFQRAIKFLNRQQNLAGSNDQPWVTNDGGFVYTAGNNGESMAGEYTDANGKRLLRSYGAMTYAGFKSMIYCGLHKDDPRVLAAWNWIQKNYTVEINPGMELNDASHARDGLYYYYHTMARALRAFGEPIITDDKGVKHDWRVELIDKVSSLQKSDGSWQGGARFMENHDTLATCLATTALEEAVADLKEHPAK